MGFQSVADQCLDRSGIGASHHGRQVAYEIHVEFKNLRLIDDRGFQRLTAEEDGGTGQTIATILAAPEPAPDNLSRDDFRRRFLALAFEAYRREEITRSKLTELASIIHVMQSDLDVALASAKLNRSGATREELMATDAETIVVVTDANVRYSMLFASFSELL